MVDPSLLLTEPGVQWLETSEDARAAAVVSYGFAEAVRIGDDDVLLRFVDSDDAGSISEARERLLYVLDGIDAFTHQQINRLPARSANVRRQLLRSEDDGEILADEFVYLVTHSWLLAKTRHVLDALRRAGVRIREHTPPYGDRLRRELIEQVIPAANIPAELTDEVQARAAIKWVIVGGTTLGLAGATGGWGAIGGLLLGPVVRAFDP